MSGHIPGPTMIEVNQDDEVVTIRIVTPNTDAAHCLALAMASQLIATGTIIIGSAGPGDTLYDGRRMQ